MQRIVHIGLSVQLCNFSGFFLMNDLKAHINQLISQSIIHSNSQEKLAEIDTQFEELIERHSENQYLLLIYNEFRIANLAKLPRKRPQILLGGPIGVVYPNFHSFPLFEIADVICLTCTKEAYDLKSAIHCTPQTTLFEILQRLPENFKPDFYWDNQIEHKHFIPHGIEEAPFPIVASICHSYCHRSIEHICQLFDLVITMSNKHAEILNKKYPSKVIALPFGINWGSFHDFIHPEFKEENKSIDASVTFSRSDASFFPYRNQVIDLVGEFKKKYGNRYAIKIFDFLPKEEYIRILQASRIAINVTAVNGPYNYRLVEAMCSGAAVFQYDWEDDFYAHKFSDLFLDGVHGVGFTMQNFEDKLIHYLENRDQLNQMAKSGYQYLVDNYSYKKLYQELIKSVKKVSANLPRGIEASFPYDCVDQIYYCQNNEMVQIPNYGMLNDCATFSWMHFNNLMVACGTLQEYFFPIEFLMKIKSLLPVEETGPDLWFSCRSFYQKAQQMVPEQFSWLVEWNFQLLRIDKGEIDEAALKKLHDHLNEMIPEPFDESFLIFKSYVLSERFPLYQLKNDAYIQLNLGLLQAFDRPHERVKLYRQFAMDALKNFLTS